MTKIDCIVHSADYIKIDKTHDFYGKKAVEIQMNDDSIEDVSTVVISKYEAEQIIAELKKQFEL